MPFHVDPRARGVLQRGLGALEYVEFGTVHVDTQIVEVVEALDGQHVVEAEERHRNGPHPVTGGLAVVVHLDPVGEPSGPPMIGDGQHAVAALVAGGAAHEGHVGPSRRPPAAIAVLRRV